MKYRRAKKIINESPMRDYDCTTGDKFTADSAITSVQLSGTDDIYYMDWDNLDHFIECISGESFSIRRVKNDIVDVPIGECDVINIASRFGRIEE